MVTMHEQDRSGPGAGAALLAFALFGMIAAGSVLVAQRRSGPAEDRWSSGRVSESADGANVEVVAVMRQVQHRSETPAFRRAELVAIAGRGSLDLSGARMADTSGRLDVVVIGGRALVKVPPEWAVVTNDSVTVGALENRARRAKAGPGRTLHLEAVVLGGRLEVTH